VSRYLMLNVIVPGKCSLGIGDAPPILLHIINTCLRGISVFLLQHRVGEEWVLLEVL
jgi:hypothetical protein